MKKLVWVLIAAGVGLCYSCQSGDKAANQGKENLDTTRAADTANKEKTATAVTADTSAAPAVAETTEYRATKEMCACVNASLKDISPRVQQLFIRAGNSERPLQVLQDEIASISDKEQEELLIQLQRFAADPKLQNCSDEIRKKYGINPDDKAAQEKVLQAAKNNKDCELVYALIRISMQQQSAATNGN